MNTGCTRSRGSVFLAFFLALTVATSPVAFAATAGSGPGPGTTSAREHVVTSKAASSGRILVGFKPGTPAVSRTAAHAATKARVKSRIHQIDVDVLEIPAGRTAAGLLNAYLRNPNVAFAEVDEVWRVESTPNDPLFWQQAQSVRIGLPDAWKLTTGSPEVPIAILDSGVDLTHPDLAGRFLPGYDFINSDADPSDDNGHGTAVAGIAAETGDNGIGYAGANWRSPIIPVKVATANGTVPWSSAAAGLVYAADHGARVANMSFSGASYSSSFMSAVDYALGKGVILCASSGNSGTEAIQYPAAYPGVLGVGSMSVSTLSAFSTSGPHVDVVAPGEGVPTTCLPNNSPYGERYFYFSGTSAASPYVAGVASLMVSMQPGLSPVQVADIIATSSTDFGDLGWDKQYGWGRINASGAVAAAGALAPSSPPPIPPTQRDTTPPTVSIVEPIADASLTNTVRIRAEATDDVGVMRVEFFVGGTLIHVASGAPYVASWSVRKLSGEYSLTAVAYDAAGNSSASQPVRVFVAAPDRNSPPKRR